MSREIAVIAALIELNGAEPPPNLANLLRCAPGSFHDLRCGETAVAIRTLRLAALLRLLSRRMAARILRGKQ